MAGDPGDPFDLERFVRAQDATWPDVVRELTDEHKHTHWSWWAFPQLRGLGSSPRALTYGIASRAEAEAYVAHPVLRARLLQVCDLLLAARTTDLVGMLGDMGETDARKVRSCMTLFAQVDPTEPRYQRVLVRYFEGRPDRKTLELLG